MTQPEYVSTTITPTGRTALRRMAAVMSGHIGQRVSMSDALRIAEHITTARPADVVTAAAALGIIPATPEGNPS